MTPKLIPATVWVRGTHIVCHTRVQLATSRTCRSTVLWPTIEMTSETSNKCGPRETSDRFGRAVPLAWLSRAAAQPGKALHVALALWSAANLQGHRTLVLSNKSSGYFCVDRNAKYRALAALEEAGLISVRRHLGKSPVVTIINQPGGDGHV